MLTRLSRLSLARFIQKSKHHIKYNMGRFLPGENKAGEAYRSKFISQIQNMTNIFLLSRLLLIKKEMIQFIKKILAVLLAFIAITVT